eukprot:50320-Pelagomonas_calceolata.AAC.1
MTKLKVEETLKTEMKGTQCSNGTLLMSWGGLGGSKLYSFNQTMNKHRETLPPQGGSAPSKNKDL